MMPKISVNYKPNRGGKMMLLRSWKPVAPIISHLELTRFSINNLVVHYKYNPPLHGNRVSTNQKSTGIGCTKVGWLNFGSTQSSKEIN